MMRHPRWSQRLNDLVAEYAHVPFDWGQHDCITFAARAVDAVLDSDLYERVRARYDWYDARSALKLIRDQGGLAKLISDVVGDPTVPFGARHGDLVLACNRFDVCDTGERSLTVRLTDRLVGPGEAGLIALPVTSSRLAWRID